MSNLEKLRQMQEDRNYDLNTLLEIADKMEEEIGAAEMWKTIKLGFSSNELIENLIYIARENDI